MSDWRTWLFHRTRDRFFLWKASVGIVVGAVLLAWVLEATRDHHPDSQATAALRLIFEDPKQTTTTEYRKLVSIS